MKKLIFATNNPHKLAEVQQLLKDEFKILNLRDIGCEEELPETHHTLEENSLEKAQFVSVKYKKDCFAEDTGLEIEALGGEPGVYSARYAGPGRDADENMAKVLKEMQGVENRNARFRTVITLIEDGVPLQFEGVVNGVISTAKSGGQGFGYDPIFRPEGYETTFAEMDAEEKSRISHRGRAIEKLVAYLKEE